MLAKLRHDFVLWHLQREKRKTRAWHAERQKNPQTKPKDVQELQQLTEREMFEVQSIEDQISRLQTTFLIDEAQRYLLPTPPFDTEPEGSWEQASTAVQYQLKRPVIAALSSAIRKEKKERREGWQAWAALAIRFVGALMA